MVGDSLVVKSAHGSANSRDSPPPLPKRLKRDQNCEIGKYLSYIKLYFMATHKVKVNIKVTFEKY